MTDQQTIFHKIVKREVPAHIVWEDDKHLAFLSIFPNTEGVTVVIPKEFQPSYFVEADEEALLNLIKACRKVARLLDRSFEDVGRTAMIFEGFGINYLHAKLFPLHGTKGEWKQRGSDTTTFFQEYPGFVSSHDASRAADSDLEELANTIRRND